MFRLDLPRYVAVILDGTIYRMKLLSYEPYKLILSNSNRGNLRQAKNRRHNFFSCSNSHILDCNRAVLLLCHPPPLHPKRGLTNLIVNNLFTRYPNLEEQIADQLGVARKEDDGKSVEGRKCSKLPSLSAFLKELVPLSDQPLV